MQKKILKTLFAVSILGIILTTAALFAIQTVIAHNTANEAFSKRLSDIEERIRLNELQIDELTAVTKEDFLSRARALAMMIELEPSIIYDREKLKDVAAALSVDEIHIIDETGFLRWGTQPEYYGMNFADTDQTRPFLAILDDPTREVAQDPMPNGSRGLMRQYAGVSLRNQKGIAQIGMVPERLEEALKNNTMQNVLHKFAVGNTGYAFAVDAQTGLISAHSDWRLIGTSPPESFQKEGTLSINGQMARYSARTIDGQTVAVVIPSDELYIDRTISTLVFLCFMILVFGVFCFVVNAHIKRSVVRGISDTVDTLQRISEGNLDTAATVRSSMEFIKLSDGINHMLFSIKAKMAEISTLAGDRQRLGALVAIADAGIIVKDEYGVVREWNIGAENILGYKPEEMINFTTHKYAPEESHAGIDEIEARLRSGEHIAHLEVVRKHKNGRLIDCSASYTPIFDESGRFDGSVSIFHDITDKKQMELALNEAAQETKNKNKTIMDSIDYASKIQRNLLPRDRVFETAFSDYSIIWSPRDIVGGDIYWMKNFDEGSLLCVCDCTGHGTPGALLTMLVASVFESAVNETNYKDTAYVTWVLDQRLAAVLHAKPSAKSENEKGPLNFNDGCDLAVLFIAHDGSVTFSSGNSRLFICDGKTVTQIKGQKIYIGEGRLKDKSDVKAVFIPANPDNKFYVASDGLFDQIGGKNNIPFGYMAFKRLILDHHHKRQADISERIWAAFESYRGEQARRDDVELITFKP